MSLSRFLEDVLELGPRPAGSEGERRAQALMLRRFEDCRLDAWTEPAAVSRAPWLLQLVNSGLGLAGAALMWSQPAIGALLLAGSVAALVGEARGDGGWTRLVLGKGLSGHVVGRALRPEGRVTLVLMAHADAPRIRLGRDILRRYVNRSWPGTRSTTGGTAAVGGTLLLAVAGAEAGGLEAPWALAAGGVCLLPLLIAFISAGVRGVLPVSRGAVSNASGLAVLAGLAGRLEAGSAGPLDIWVVGLGSSADAGAGAEAFLRRFGPVLPRESTYFLNLLETGYGELGYALGEGRPVCPHSPAFTSLVPRALAASGLQAEPIWLVRQTDAAATARAGYPSFSLVGIRERGPVAGSWKDRQELVSAEAVRRTLDFVEALCGVLERDAMEMPLLARPAGPGQMAREGGGGYDPPEPASNDGLATFSEPPPAGST